MALRPLLLPIGAWGPGVTQLPKVDFARRVRQSLPVTSRECPDMYPALWRPGLGLRDDRSRKSSRSARQNSRALRRNARRVNLFTILVHRISESVLVRNLGCRGEEKLRRGVLGHIYIDRLATSTFHRSYTETSCP